MTPEQIRRIEDVLRRAQALPPAQWPTFLEAACGDDPTVRVEVERRLESADPDATRPSLWRRLAPQVPGPAPKPAAPAPDEPRGRRIGPYQLLQKLGEGGMGVVYLAEQTEPVRRRVALKLIKLGMDTKEVIARFESERQALALMNHANIAAVLDAGATDDGRPYFVMEYVAGEPLTAYCDKHKLGLPERLHLFMQVCHAVQHAHQKAVIHRDLKPGNILVVPTTEPEALARKGAEGPRGRWEKSGAGGAPVRAAVKVIDFGVAKAVNQRLTEHTIFTEHGLLIGTPEYMSPEQAEMTTLDIDTRTDIYSLGVILYELLTGTLPFSRETLRKAGYAGIQRIIREVEPPKPSTRLGQLSGAAPRQATGVGTWEGGNVGTETAESAPVPSHPHVPTFPHSHEIAHRRQTDPKTLLRQVRGELDWIVMKCLEKDRTRRYDTANGVALDVQRFLNHEPVLAGPPSAAYRIRKFVRRNRGAVLAGALTAGALLLGIAGATSGLVWALREQERARIEANNARGAEQEQRRERERADKAVAEMKAAKNEVDSVNAQRTHQLAEQLRKDRIYRAAIVMFRIAVPKLQETIGPRAAQTIDATCHFAECLMQVGEYSEAVAMLRPLISEVDKTTVAWMKPLIMSLLGEAVMKQRQFEDAEPFLLDSARALEKSNFSAARQLAIDRVIELYTSWHAAEPDKGYDQKAAVWRAKLAE